MVLCQQWANMHVHVLPWANVDPSLPCYLGRRGQSDAGPKEFKGKIEKVPRGIRGEESSKDMASSRNLVSTIGA